jgi:hypothetical protein
LNRREFREATVLMAASSVILIALSVGLPGFLTGVAVIVAVCRADKRDLAEIIRAAVKIRAASSAVSRTLDGPQTRAEERVQE